MAGDWLWRGVNIIERMMWEKIYSARKKQNTCMVCWKEKGINIKNHVELFGDFVEHCSISNEKPFIRVSRKRVKDNLFFISSFCSFAFLKDHNHSSYVRATGL